MEQLKRISPSEVRLHRSKDSCWLVIHGKVYDVTKFLDDHPGGDEVLVHASGTGDATQSFEDVGHSSAARKRMTGYVIGVLEGYDPSKDSGAKGAEDGKEKPAKKLGVVSVQKPSHSLSDYTLPLFLLVLAVASWFLVNDKITPAQV